MSAVPAGYKQTEVGVIPEDWRITNLESLSAFITKGSTPTTYGFKWESSGVLFLRSECVSADGLDLTQSMFISPAAHSTLRRSEVVDGDILVTITGNVGRVVRLSGVVEANLNQHIARVRITADDADGQYVYHFLAQPETRRRFNSITTGQAYPQISLKQVREAAIPLPPSEEQRAIAAALSDVDALLAKLDRFIAKKRDLKQAAMQQLLTGQTRLPGFSGAWEERTCSELVNGGDNIVDGPFGSNLKNSDFVSSGIPVLQGINISGDKFVWRDVRYVSEQKAKEVFRSNAAPGDLLTVKIGSVGFSALIEHLAGHDFAIIPANLLRLRFKAGSADARFVYYVLTSNKGKRALKDLAGNTAQPAIGLSGFRKLSFLVPLDIKEQAAIATVLSDMDAELAALEARRDKTRALKQGMMQELLTGRIRLI